ncbi:MAG: hypothetical protein QOJ99_4722 [Bryobacterales bacterium]|nr:hypothetical protein [Bryobacterales bacterium]
MKREEGSRELADARARDDVPREGGANECACSTGVRNRGVGIVDGDQLPVGGQGFGEVAGTLESGGSVDDAREGEVLDKAFEVAEEEGAIPDDAATERTAELILVDRGKGRAGGVAEEVVRIEGGVLQVFESAAVELLEPDLPTALMTPPVVRPYAAEAELVMTLNSCVESVVRKVLGPAASPILSMATPSIRKAPVMGCAPPMFTAPTQPGGEYLSAEITYALYRRDEIGQAHRVAGVKGKIDHFWLSIVVPTSELLGSSSGVLSTTSTVSDA